MVDFAHNLPELLCDFVNKFEETKVGSSVVPATGRICDIREIGGYLRRILMAANHQAGQKPPRAGPLMRSSIFGGRHQ
jgi:hypothetical protein